MSSPDLNRGDTERIALKVSREGLSIPDQKIAPGSHVCPFRSKAIRWGQNQLALSISGYEIEDLERREREYEERKLSRALQMVMMSLGGYDGFSVELFTRQLEYLKENGIEVKGSW